jgi:hypothetical protein
MKIGGEKPTLIQHNEGVSLTHSGYARLKNVEKLLRNWQFNQNSMHLTSKVSGTGKRNVTQYFFTPLEITQDSKSLVLKGKNQNFRLSTHTGYFNIFNAIRWSAYGKGEKIQAIRLNQDQSLPWKSTVNLEVI